MDQSLFLLQSCFASFNGTSGRVYSSPEASVLVLLIMIDKILHFLFTKRTRFVRKHKGEVSFPGGMREGNDYTIVETALREAEEELGLKPNSFVVLGTLDVHYTLSGIAITPVEAYLHQFPKLTINKAEVAEVFYVPVSEFLHETVYESITTHFGEDKMYYFCYYSRVIWGATAAIARRVARIINGTLNLMENKQ